VQRQRAAAAGIVNESRLNCTGVNYVTAGLGQPDECAWPRQRMPLTRVSAAAARGSKPRHRSGVVAMGTFRTSDSGVLTFDRSFCTNFMTYSAFHCATLAKKLRAAGECS